MDVSEAIRLRKSVRSFDPREVEEEKLQRILEAARLAPSATNGQEWRFVIVREEGTRKELAVAAANQAFVGEAPILLVCCAETDHRRMSCGLECFPIDVAIAIDHITLAAVEEDLGTCWIGAFDAKEVKRILGIPDEIEVVELLPLGYPQDPSLKNKNRLPLAEIIHYERWQK